MNKIILLIIIILFIVKAPALLRVFNAESKAELNAKSLAEELKAYDVIFFGEEHINQEIHDLQSDILPFLIEDGGQLIISYEMWERDVQKIMDAFLADEISEEAFLEQSRPWPNYEQYRPSLFFAKDNSLKVIAANVPRVYAARVSKEGFGFIESLPPEERQLLSNEYSAPDDGYKAFFIRAMSHFSAHKMPDEVMERYYQAQILKDATMAESIAKYIDESPKARVLHYNGDFHSKSYFGTVAKLKAIKPELKIAVITCVKRDERNDEDILKEFTTKEGSHLLIFDSQEER